MLRPSHSMYCLALGLSLEIYEFTFDEIVKTCVSLPHIRVSGLGTGDFPPNPGP